MCYPSEGFRAKYSQYDSVSFATDGLRKSVDCSCCCHIDAIVTQLLKLKNFSGSHDVVVNEG